MNQLHIVRTEMLKCNGSIQVESDVGRGTTFTLIYPISKMHKTKRTAA